MRFVHVFIALPTLCVALSLQPPPAIVSSKSSIASIAPPIKGSTIQLIEPNTNCTVVLVGCFHGSQSSAADVTTCLTSDKTDIVVLELCASRYADLRRLRNNASIKQQPWLKRFGSMVASTGQKQGWQTGIAAALVGSVSGLQTCLSGLEPGLEFTTAQKHVQNTPNCDIVLADQNVDETLQRLGQVPVISKEMWKKLLTTKSWQESFESEAVALSTALWGDKLLPMQVNLWQFWTRSTGAMQDLLRLALPPFVLFPLFATTLSNLLSIAISGTNGDTSLLQQAETVSNSHSEVAVLGNILILAFAYMSVALPATRVILQERDDCLVRGIQAACKVAAEERQHDREPRVVAVLGWLHINGVAQRLLQQKQE